MGKAQDRLRKNPDLQRAQPMRPWADVDTHRAQPMRQWADVTA
ncbi:MULTISPECIES: hypothetical protein [Achromobacter]|nr:MULTISPECIES: hypothetical protein [Achromobacter]